MIGIPTEAENPKGLHQRYKVTKTSGEPVDPTAIYFVLRLDALGDDKLHIRASRVAALAYAKCIKSDAESSHLDELASDLAALVWDLEGLESES